MPTLFDESKPLWLQFGVQDAKRGFRLVASPISAGVTAVRNLIHYQDQIGLLRKVAQHCIPAGFEIVQADAVFCFDRGLWRFAGKCFAEGTVWFFRGCQIRFLICEPRYAGNADGGNDCKKAMMSHRSDPSRIAGFRMPPPDRLICQRSHPPPWFQSLAAEVSPRGKGRRRHVPGSTC